MNRNRVLAVTAAGLLGTIALSGAAWAPTSVHHAAISGHAASRAMLASVTNTQIINDYAGLCLDAENDSSDNPNHNGDKVQLWTCTGHANQKWYVYNFGASDPILNGRAQPAALALDAVESGAGNNGDPVQLWQDNNGLQQLWVY